ncbi:MAG: hypothetical protein Q9174_004837 [Haloplaca sp. 1 TL-2023]
MAGLGMTEEGMFWDPSNDLEYGDDHEDDDGLGEIGDLPCHPVLDSPESERPKPAVQAHVKAQMTKNQGQVRHNDNAGGQLEWFDKVRKAWRPAVYHSDIRRQLVEEASQAGTYRMVTIKLLKTMILTFVGHEMSHGKDRLDVTAFHPMFANNGAQREHWPKILLQYLSTPADYQDQKPGIWTWHDGRVILDLNDDAMRNFAELPVTLASNADAWLLQACMRLNNNINYQDFRGRMPGGLKDHAADPLRRTRISVHLLTFRKYACCLTWKVARTIDHQRQYLDKKLPIRCHRLNSTESFRNLDAWEVAELESLSAGKCLSKSRGTVKDTSAERSRALVNRKMEQVKKLKKKFLRDNGGPCTDDYDEEDATYHLKHNCPRNHAQVYPFITTGPKSVADAELIRKLLKPTRKHYRWLTGHSAPRTEADECYICQFLDIEEEMVRWNREYRFSGMEPGDLIGIDGVDDDSFCWNHEWDTEMFGEKIDLGDERAETDRTEGSYW